ncbi:transporter substrate-binding domain-containing protein [Anaerobium acetethylicum]|uniref:Putative lysine transport system substrate-binding protein n=1 Tax=Anaerobium acetethylicum TaxID=1619234 RepID=A0A1D3TRQ1_9FIRM|nr:transporter substrate-binding domain-containing protein [Anaerobium acetethylicum]SCP96401.1 putative lysine transport system substrate-binding protein [Anaerobium acetethylicum]
MKKRTVSVLLCIILVVSLLAGCGAVKSSAKEEKKVLRVGMECAYAPFNWTQSSEEVSNGDKAVPIYGSEDYAYGYDVMLAQKLADELGWELEIHKVEWSSIVLGMNSGDYDVIIAGMGYTEERDNSVDFTDPYYIRNNVLIVNREGAYADVKTLADFTGASATTQIGTIWEQYVPQIPDVNQLTYYETTSEIVMAVSMGAADCGVLDEPTAMSASIANPDINYVKLDDSDGFIVPEGQSLNVCVAVKEGNSELQKSLDDALDAIEWDEAKMADLMNLAVELQPLSE